MVVFFRACAKPQAPRHAVRHLDRRVRVQLLRDLRPHSGGVSPGHRRAAAATARRRGLILLAYLILGAVFDEISAMLITLPFILPVILKLGYDAFGGAFSTSS